MPEPHRRCPQCRATYGGDVLFCPADGTPLTSRPVGEAVERFIGRTLHGDVTLEALLGVGAMASVFRGRQAGVDRAVAVKILHAELAADPVMVARFRREGRAAARIRHPNVVEVIGSGNLEPDTESAAPQPYLVLEYLDGLTLRSALSASGGVLPLARAVSIALELCDAVGAAHDLGIVHRDLKPENVMLVRRGDDTDFVKLLDFGLSRFGEAEAGISTHAGAVLGTARYLSPEGARGEPVGPPADVYTIATLLFECLAGRTPFEGDRPVAILVKKSSERAPELSDLERGRAVPAPLCELVARALELDPTKRPGDARTLGQALAEAARASGLGAHELFARPTLFGTGSARRLPASAPTQVLGSPAVVTSRSGGASSPRAASVPPEPVTTGSALPALRRIGILVACFTLGVVGALALATHVGGCGGAGH